MNINSCSCRRYFVHSADDFPIFAKEVCRIFQNDISPVDVVKLILQHRVEVLKLAPASIFVFVDEFRKLFEKCNRPHGNYRGQDLDVLSSIGVLISQSAKHTVVISTLENTALVDDGSSTDLVCLATPFCWIRA